MLVASDGYNGYNVSSAILNMAFLVASFVLPFLGGNRNIMHGSFLVTTLDVYYGSFRTRSFLEICHHEIKSPNLVIGKTLTRSRILLLRLKTMSPDTSAVILIISAVATPRQNL
ncbi:hypothetical protein AB6A40_004887 [Gnathostoma spinigerum]|uniref:Uncharacterized protein n=1 Tax=Gnathostoma spinigerum TaxID=75299 RepID=A0ABD6EMJ0_9BILA